MELNYDKQKNSNFIDNNAVYYGGAVFFADTDTVENCNL